MLCFFLFFVFGCRRVVLTRWAKNKTANNIPRTISIQSCRWLLWTPKMRERHRSLAMSCWIRLLSMVRCIYLVVRNFSFFALYFAAGRPRAFDPKSNCGSNGYKTDVKSTCGHAIRKTNGNYIFHGRRLSACACALSTHGFYTHTHTHTHSRAHSSIIQKFCYCMRPTSILFIRVENVCLSDGTRQAKTHTPKTIQNRSLSAVEMIIYWKIVCEQRGNAGRKYQHRMPPSRNVEYFSIFGENVFYAVSGGMRCLQTNTCLRC